MDVPAGPDAFFPYDWYAAIGAARDLYAYDNPS